MARKKKQMPDGTVEFSGFYYRFVTRLPLA